jgi:hypothetical protein
MRKPLALAATVIFASLVILPQAAFADDENGDDSSWQSIYNQGNEDHAPNQPPFDPKHKHQKLEHQYGDVDQVGVPPIAIRPGVQPDPGTFELPITPSNVVPSPGVSTLGEVEETTSANSATEEAQEFIATKLGVTFISQSEGQTVLPSKINPAKSTPIQIRELVLTTKTPADEFLDSAMVFGAGLGVLAVGLLGVTGFSALKLRREAKTD